MVYGFLIRNADEDKRAEIDAVLEGAGKTVQSSEEEAQLAMMGLADR